MSTEWVTCSRQPSACLPVVELSDTASFRMHDAYYEHATPDHFWIDGRFRILQHLLDEFELGDEILDVGCGNGVVQGQFERALGRPVLGCDLNLKAMQDGVASKGQRYLYNVLDERAEWQGHFDTVLLLDTLEHIEQPIDFLKAIGSHLCAGGRLVVNVPAMPDLYSRYDEAQGHVRRYTTDQLQHELAEAGFQLSASMYWGSNLVPIARLRKWWINRSQADDVFARGFAPPGKLAEIVLNRLLAMERHGVRFSAQGTSLAAVAIFPAGGGR